MECAYFLYFDEMESEVEEIRSYFSEDDDPIEILKTYFKKNIEKYNSIDNIYKIAYEGYRYSLDEGQTSDEALMDGMSLDIFEEVQFKPEENDDEEISLDEFEKFRFEADLKFDQAMYNTIKYMESELNSPFSTAKDYKRHLVYAGQMKNIQDFILETHIANHKSIESKMYLEHLENDYEEIINYNFSNFLSSFKRNGLSNDGVITLFNKKSDYEYIIELLIHNEVVKLENRFLKFVNIEKGIAIKRLICCFGYILINKGYLKVVSYTELVKALQTTFQTNISKQVYDQAHKFFDEESPKALDYLSVFYFIPKKE